tara:strand:- start:2729 stop:2890 length:162 start_codon:yes stop_codon:yes gene_type:complete
MGYYDDVNLSNKRGEHETYEEYKARRKKNNASVKTHLAGFDKDENKTKLTKKK